MLEEKLSPMLAYTSKPFDSPRHIYEVKWDGARCILFMRGNQIRLQNRALIDITLRYPELVGIDRDIEAKNAILDGELVVLSGGKPDFSKLQQREHLSDPLKIELLSHKIPATYITFDLLFLNDTKCIDAPLIERKETLKAILRESSHLLESQYIGEHGKSFFREAVERGFEGIMAKSINSPYLLGKRSRYWLKIKPEHSAICHIIGYTKGEGFRQPYFGSLALATLEEKQWVYRGRVGTGFTEADIKRISAELKNLKVDSAPIPMSQKVKSIQWVRPKLRCEVTFQEVTARGHFRAPVLKRLIE